MAKKAVTKEDIIIALNKIRKNAEKEELKENEKTQIEQYLEIRNKKDRSVSENKILMDMNKQLKEELMKDLNGKEAFEELLPDVAKEAENAIRKIEKKASKCRLFHWFSWGEINSARRKLKELKETWKNADLNHVGTTSRKKYKTTVDREM